MRYVYTIAGMTLLLEVPFDIDIQADSRDFLRPAEPGEALSHAIPVRFTPVTALPPDPGSYPVELRLYRETPDTLQVRFCTCPNSAPYALVQSRLSPLSMECLYLQSHPDWIVHSHNLVDLLGLETLLSLHNGFLLHSALIRWQGKGILFSAPSGTGKSTQADLWVRFEKADLLNGDRAAVRMLPDGFTAFGLPYAGSSGIYRNEQAPLAAIFILRQGPRNVLRRLPPAEAFVWLYSETLIHRWDPRYTARTADTLTELVSRIPVFMLSCLPDRGAVDLARQAVETLPQEILS